MKTKIGDRIKHKGEFWTVVCIYRSYPARNRFNASRLFSQVEGPMRSNMCLVYSTDSNKISMVRLP